MKSGVCGTLFAAFAAAVLTAAVSPATAMAADVSRIELTFTDRYETGEILEPDISCGTSGVSIDSVDWSREPENWRPGTSVTATLTLSSGGDFASSYGSRTCRVTGAEFKSAKKNGDALTVKVSYEPVVQLAAPESAGWNNLEKTTAKWSRVEYATGYEIRLYRDTNYVRTVDAGNTVTKDLSEYMTEDGTYDYEVRAVGKDRSDAKYRKSSEYTRSTDRILEDMGDSEGRWRLYADGKQYEKEDGSVVTDQWYKIGGQWYYFGADGYADTGWQQVSGSWYYLDDEGIMQTGWQEIAGTWYFLREDGSMATGWVEDQPGKWYYLNPDGSMAAGTVVDGCRLDESGLWTEG